jgi:hypothetical protein
MSNLREKRDMGEETAVLRRLVGLAMASSAAGFWQRGLAPEVRPVFAATYFLLDNKPGRDVETFIHVTMKRLLQQLTRRTERQPVTYQGQVRGRIDWAATYKARYSQDYDPTRYVCHEVRRQYDTPENRLLKYMVEQVTTCMSMIPEALRQGSCYTPATNGQPGGQLATIARIQNLQDALINSRASVRLRDISLPDTIDESYLVRAETSRTEEYAEVAYLYRHYQQVVLSLSWKGIVAIGRRVLVLPAAAGAEEDAWIRLGAAILHA